ncbi:hypothetical protein SETIT_8G244700v2 [Setaria italica]|uniref:Knottin scorpion toxin-like domain-containing protein n=2 Tax=Setaria TaxID=4554 RepID=A0A368SB86_SETIT|nr:hypothetical protein SETIT_8G244700v2 [Setaria italica]TKW02670.1 hypothetical protein SEVIR_8G255200v2 [Setaria viridis]
MVRLTTFMVLLAIMSWTTSVPCCQAMNGGGGDDVSRVLSELGPPFCFEFDPEYCNVFQCGKVCEEYSFPPNRGFCNQNVHPWECCCRYLTL